MPSLGKDVNSGFILAYALDSTAATAGGSGDATEAAGASLDTQALATKAGSVSFLIGAKCSLTAAKTLTVAARIQHSVDNSVWTDLVALATLLTLSATGTNTGSCKVGSDLTGAKRYVRVAVTPDLSASGTDTATIFAVAVFGGLQELPQ